MTPNAGDWQCVVVKLMQMQDMINGASYMTPSGSLQRHCPPGCISIIRREKVIQYGHFFFFFFGRAKLCCAWGRKVIEDCRVIPMYYLLGQDWGSRFDARYDPTQ